MEKKQLSGKLAVILHADVVGSISSLRWDESLAHQQIQQAFQRFHRLSQDTKNIRGNFL